jgi:hypothetical protein
MLRLATVPLLLCLATMAAACTANSTTPGDTTAIVKPTASPLLPDQLVTVSNNPSLPPPVQMEPPSPRIGDRVTVQGRTLPSEVVTIWIHPLVYLGADMPGSDTAIIPSKTGGPGQEQGTVKLGTAQADSRGDYSFSFEMKEDIGRNAAGENVRLVIGQRYTLELEVKSFQGYQTRVFPDTFYLQPKI